MTEEEIWGSCQIINDLFESLEAMFPDFTPKTETAFNLKPPSPEAIIQLKERTKKLASSTETSPKQIKNNKENKGDLEKDFKVEPRLFL